MAGEDRSQTSSVEFWQALQSRTHRFGFYEALRLLECAHPDKPRLGESRRPADDPVRLAQKPDLAFAPSTLAVVEPGHEGRPPRLAVYHPGLFGPNGALPLHLTEYVRDRERDHGDKTFQRFADVFHHRLLSLFYRAWAQSQPTVQYDRPSADRFSVYIGSLFGMGWESARDRDAFPDLAKLHHAGTLACQTRHADGLRSMLADFFGVPVEVEEFLGHWMDLPKQSYWRLGETPETGCLGQTTVVGARVWDVQQKFRIRLGPVDLAEYRRLLPSRDSMRRLSALVRNYVGDELDWDVVLVLDRDEVPPLALGGDGRLGWTTWVSGRKPETDAADLVLSSAAAAARGPSDSTGSDVDPNRSEELANV